MTIDQLKNAESLEISNGFDSAPEVTSSIEKPKSSRGRHFAPSRKPVAIRWVVLALILLLTIATRIPGLDQALTDKHNFRQTHTAFQALLFHQEGIDLLHPRLPVLGNGEIPFEFPLFQAIASVPMAYGMSPDVAMRSTALFFFVLTALFIFPVTRRLFGTAAAFAATLLFCFSPFAMVWSKSSTIETAVMAFSIIGMWATLKWAQDKHLAKWKRLSLFAIASVSITAGMLVKATTEFAWLPFVVLIILLESAFPKGSLISALKKPLSMIRPLLRTGPAFALLVVLPTAIASAWTRYGDNIKAGDPQTAWLTTEGLKDFRFGTWHQRTILNDWHIIADRLSLFAEMLPWVATMAILAFFAIRSRHRTATAGIVLAALLPPLVFFNPHVIHDYYFNSITVQFAIVFGWLFGLIYSKMKNHKMEIVSGVTLVVLISLALYGNRDYWLPGYSGKTTPVGAIAVADNTLPTDRLVVGAQDWNTSTFYYARRHGEMLPAALDNPDSYANILRKPIDGAVTLDPSPAFYALIGVQQWIGTSHADIVHTGPNLERVSKDPMVSTDDKNILNYQTVSNSKSQPVQTMNCVRGAEIKLPKMQGTVVYQLTGIEKDQYLVPNEGAQRALAFIPAKGYLMVRDGAVERLSCRGTGAITITVALSS